MKDWELGFKTLTVENWLEADPTMSFMGGSAQQWVREFLAVELNASLPRSLRRRFAVARGALLYGYFFYPLYALGHDELHRVAELALRLRVAELGGPQRKNFGFTNGLEWLVRRGRIAPEHRLRWEIGKDVRHGGTHATEQTQLPPSFALRTLKGIADEINGLFRPDVP